MKYKGSDIPSYNVGDAIGNTITVDGVVKWRKPITITLARAEGSHLTFGETDVSKTIQTKYGYQMYYTVGRITGRLSNGRPYSRPAYYFQIKDGDLLITQVKLSDEVPTRSFANGSTIIDNQTLTFTPKKYSVSYSNKDGNTTISASVDGTSESFGSFTSIHAYKDSTIVVTVQSLHRLNNESQFDDVDYDDNDNLIYVKTINKITEDVNFDLTLASE